MQTIEATTITLAALTFTVLAQPAFADDVVPVAPAVATTESPPKEVATTTPAPEATTVVVTQPTEDPASRFPRAVIARPLTLPRGLAMLRADAAAMGPFVAGAIPFPTAGTPGQRLRVRLLNGTTDLGANLAAVPKVVGAGGEVVLLGNASRFGATATTVEYGDASLAPRVEAIASAIGGTTKAVDETSDAFDVTITLGPAVP